MISQMVMNNYGFLSDAILKNLYTCMQILRFYRAGNHTELSLASFLAPKLEFSSNIFILCRAMYTYVGGMVCKKTCGTHRSRHSKSMDNTYFTQSFRYIHINDRDLPLSFQVPGSIDNPTHSRLLRHASRPGL